MRWLWRPVAAAAVALALTAGCAGSTPAPRWFGIAYPQSVEEPAPRFPATTGAQITLPRDAGGRAVVVLFGALRNGDAQAFMSRVESAARELSRGDRQRLMLVLATTDPDHDSLAALRAALRPLQIAAVGVRGTFDVVSVIGLGPPGIGPPGRPDSEVAADGASAPPVSAIAELEIGGMTCGACAARVQRGLNKFDGVHAKVNVATSLAWIQMARPVPPETLVAPVEATGYTAALLVCMPLGDLSLGVVVRPWMRFPGWPWVLLALTVPVVTWCAWPIHAAAWRAARHGAMTMDTLVSVGVIVSCGWSFWTIFFRQQGIPANPPQLEPAVATGRIGLSGGGCRGRRVRPRRTAG